MLVSGVCRLWLTPRRKSSLAASSSRSRAFCGPTRSNSCALRTATPISLANSSSRSWSARSQPRVAGKWPTSTPSRSSPARSSARTGQRLARDAFLDVDRRAGRPGAIRASTIPNAVRASSAARPIEPVDAVARRRGDQRGEDPAELPVAPLELGGEPVVALGEAGQLVVSGDHDRRASGRRSRPGRRPPRSRAAGRSGRTPSAKATGPRASAAIAIVSSRTRGTVSVGLGRASARRRRRGRTRRAAGPPPRRARS